MSDRSAIEWTDATWNPVVGCQVETPGCTHCYAMKLAGGRMRNHPTREGLTIDTKAGPVWNGNVRFNATELWKPLSWTRSRRIFAVAHGDLFYSGVPQAWIDRVFAIAAMAGRHTFQLLTKRHERLRDYLLDPATPDRIARACLELRPARFATNYDWPIVQKGPLLDLDDVTLQRWALRNVWIGVSVEDQKRADLRRAAVREVAERGWLTWVSYEPAIGAVDWTGWEFIRWLVSGGESGAGARPSHPDWHRAARDYCNAGRIPYVFKQWGDWAPWHNVGISEGIERCVDGKDRRLNVGRDGAVGGNPSLPGDATMYRLGKKAAGRLLDGRTWDQYPMDLG